MEARSRRDVIKGRDGVVRGAKVRKAKGILERAIQQLHPLELSCDEPERTPDTRALMPTLWPKSDAAAAPTLRMEQLPQTDRE